MEEDVVQSPLRTYAFRIAAVDELGGKTATDFTVTVLPAAGGGDDAAAVKDEDDASEDADAHSPSSSTSSSPTPSPSSPSSPSSAFPVPPRPGTSPIRIPDAWAGAIAREARERGGIAGGSTAIAASSSSAGADVARGDDDEEMTKRITERGDAGEGYRAGELKASAAAAAAGSEKKRRRKKKKFTGAQIFGIVVGALGGAAVLAALVGLMWSRERERKRRQNVIRQVNMAQL